MENGNVAARFFPYLLENGDWILEGIPRSDIKQFFSLLTSTQFWKMLMNDELQYPTDFTSNV